MRTLKSIEEGNKERDRLRTEIQTRKKNENKNRMAKKKLPNVMRN